MDKYSKELAKILEECKDFRKEQGLSQMFVADVMDCQQQEVSKLERGGLKDGEIWYGMFTDYYCKRNRIVTEDIINFTREYNLIISVKKVSRDIKNIDFNDNYFENIDTEEKAYFLGLIYSDGNVRERNGKYYLNIELKREDKYILEKFASELRCGNKIYDRDRITNFGESHMSSFTT